MSFHHWMYFGCQCSSARWSRLLLERLTLFGIFSAEIIRASCPFPVELRPPLLSVHLERAFVTDGVWPLEDPVLPRGQAPEDLRLHRFGPRKAQVRLEAGHRVWRKCRTRLDREPDFVVPVDFVRRERDETRLLRF